MHHEISFYMTFISSFITRIKKDLLKDNPRCKHIDKRNSLLSSPTILTLLSAPLHISLYVIYLFEIHSSILKYPTKDFFLHIIICLSKLMDMMW